MANRGCKQLCVVNHQVAISHQAKGVEEPAPSTHPARSAVAPRRGDQTAASTPNPTRAVGVHSRNNLSAVRHVRHNYF